MGQRIVRRYSACFKQQVVAELESGRFDSIEAARRHYEVGESTIQKWLKRLGRNDLKAKVVRVEAPDEADRIRQLQQQVEQLERALGQTQARNVLNEQYLKLACEQLGQEVGTFVKKCDGGPSTRRSKDQP
jgi:transposase-like protein